MYNLLLLSYDVSINTGGIQNTGYILSEYLARKMKLTIICGSESTPPCSDNIKCYKINHLQYGLSYFHRKAEEIESELLEEENFDFALSLVGYMGLSLISLKKKAGIPYGSLVHGSELFKPHFVFKKKNFREFLSFIKWVLVYRRTAIKGWKNTINTLENADILFSNTNFTKKLLSNYVKNRNIIVIHPPIYTLPPNNDYQKITNHNLFSVGRLTSRKGFHFVIQALPKICKVVPDIKYIIAGSGEMELELKALVNELHLEDKVVFLGRVDDATKNQLMMNCGTFITTSYTEKRPLDIESFGIVYVEANAYGKYVIAADTGGVGEAVIDGETGILVEQKNVDQIAEAVIKVFSDDFKYDPQKCIENAKANHVSVISEKYYNEIDKFLKAHES